MPGTRTVSGENLSKRGLCGGRHKHPTPASLPLRWDSQLQAGGGGGTIQSCPAECLAGEPQTRRGGPEQAPPPSATPTWEHPASVACAGPRPQGRRKRERTAASRWVLTGVGTSADPQPTEEQENPDATPFSVPSHQECCLFFLSQGFLESRMACNFLYSRDWP